MIPALITLTLRLSKRTFLSQILQEYFLNFKIEPYQIYKVIVLDLALLKKEELKNFHDQKKPINETDVL